MKKFLVFIVCIGALYYFKPSLFDFSSGAFDESGSPRVLLFTFRQCGQWCDKAIQELERRKVDYEEIDIQKSQANESLYNSMGRGGMPYLVVGKSKLVGFNKERYATTLAQNLGEQPLTYRERRYYRNHFYDDGSPMIYMYGASWCPYCKKMREEFNQRNLDFVELDVERSDDPGLLANTMGIGGYPTVFVGYTRIERGTDINAIIKATKTAINRQ